jgi:hypothetical protein
MTRERAALLACRRVPEVELTVVPAAAEEGLPVGGEGDGALGWEAVQFFSRGSFPGAVVIFVISDS